MSKSDVTVDLAYLNSLEDESKRLKPYGWGIVDKDGKAFFDEHESTVDVKERLIKSCLKDVDYDNPKGAPHRVVQLFYKDES